MLPIQIVHTFEFQNFVQMFADHDTWTLPPPFFNTFGWSVLFSTSFISEHFSRNAQKRYPSVYTSGAYGFQNGLDANLYKIREALLSSARQLLFNNLYLPYLLSVLNKIIQKDTFITGWFIVRINILSHRGHGNINS